MTKNIKKDLKFGQIMGINVTSTTPSEVLTAVKEKVSHSSKLGSRNIKFSIVTPNPELVLMAQDNNLLRDALNNADYAIPDGVGLKYASQYLTGRKLNIIPGRKLFLELIELANENKWKVFLLGGMNNEAILASQRLISLYPNIFISSDKGPKLNQKGKPATQVDIKLYKDAVDRINKFKPDLLFVAFGNPRQEIWIHRNLRLLKIHGIMAVGGTFRYIAGLSKLPPKWMENLGLEWLYRLITEPYRIDRVFRAVILFPLKVFLYKLSSPSLK